jgi:hypothetical protein
MNVNIISEADDDDEEEDYLSYLLGAHTYGGDTDPTDVGEWIPAIPNVPVVIGIDDVDAYLLGVARREVATVKRLG